MTTKDLAAEHIWFLNHMKNIILEINNQSNGKYANGEESWTPEIRWEYHQKLDKIIKFIYSKSDTRFGR